MQAVDLMCKMKPGPKKLFPVTRKLMLRQDEEDALVAEAEYQGCIVADVVRQCIRASLDLPDRKNNQP